VDQRQRVRAALEKLGLLTAEREECVLALLDTSQPNPFDALADAGLRFNAGAGTQQIFRFIAPRLGRESIDREARDQIMLPLREVGVLRIGYADTENRAVELNYWKPKSPNNVYVVTDDFQALLAVGDDAFEDQLNDWVRSSDQRLLRMATAEAAAAASHEDARLVPLTIEHYCPVALSSYEVVFTDDVDAREHTDWSENIERFDLPLDLSSRWPDIILHDPTTGHFWIIDCVDSDGEIDAVRKAEIESAFEGRGHVIDGYTTVYRTIGRFAQRQRSEDNIAVGTHVWIMEVGGAHWLKKPLG
jgi:BsuBI/PstI restriction endonuclease domain